MPYFTVNILEASGLKETELLGKQDPYVEIRTNADRKFTSTHHNGGKNPSINCLSLLTISLERGKATGCKPTFWYYGF